MGWLANLDARVERCPAPVQWCYVALKATLIVIGAIALGRTLLDKLGIWPYFPTP
jgi:hypothetical protein